MYTDTPAMINMYIYVASSQAYRTFPAYKIGCTEDPYKRLHKSRTWWYPHYKINPANGQSELEFDITYDRVFLTSATMHTDMLLIERAFHTHFAQYRATRECADDNEWFDFEGACKSGYDPLREIDMFAASMPNIVRSLSQDEIARICTCANATEGRARSLSSPPRAQLVPFVPIIVRAQTAEKLAQEHACALSTKQEPVVKQIRAFLDDGARAAGYVIAPCGSGKTVMMCDALRETIGDSECTRPYNVIICAPNACIQRQWRETLINRRVFESDCIHMINSEHESVSKCVDKYIGACAYMQDACKHACCAIVTYTSSHLLMHCIETYHIDLMIFDEAHHLAGIVAQDDGDTGIGRTRKLAMLSIDYGIKRIALTYTPRIVRVRDSDNKVEFLSMDDCHAFGTKIASLDLRKLINDGILPDYRILAMRPHLKNCASTSSEALPIMYTRNAQVCKCILKVWIKYAEKLNHLIIFARTLDDVREIGAYISERAMDTCVLCIFSGDNVQQHIEQFSQKPRAILINCYKISEGVDVPCADSVAIAYAKESHGQITQMILRAGRWHPNKSIFHVLIPIIDNIPRSASACASACASMNTSASALTEVLIAMATNDSLICDKLMLHAQKQLTGDSQVHDETDDGDSANHDIRALSTHIELIDFDSTDIASICQLIAGTYSCIITQGSGNIREICARLGIRTSIDYEHLRERMLPDLPEHPWEHTSQTAYAFLHEYAPMRALPSVDEFRANMRSLGIACANQYTASIQRARSDILAQPGEWRGSVSFVDYPDVQNILDGCFGPRYDQFAKLINDTSIIIPANRRRSGRPS